MSNKCKTLLEYMRLDESRADDDYNKSFSEIDRDIFNKICLMDPKTQRSGDKVINIGFGAKQLLLPKYLTGETDFVDKADTVTSALNAYYPNIKNYPKFPEFESVSAFLDFMSDPVEVIDVAKSKNKPEDKISLIYNKYYTDIPKKDFDAIIAIDPETTDEKIGDIAKNLLLRCYRNGDSKFLDNPDAVTSAIYRFIEMKASYESDKQNLMNYKTISDFVNYLPPSPTISALSGTDYAPIEGTDYIHIASSKNYDIFRALTFRGSERIAHSRGAQNVWCTAGGSDGRHYGASADHHTATSYWHDYIGKGKLYMFIHKTMPTDKTKNWNMSYAYGGVYHFLNGDNSGPYGAEYKENDIHKNWEAFLLANPDVASVLAACSDSDLSNDVVVKKINLTAQYLSKPLVISKESHLYDFFINSTAYKSCVKELIIKNIKKIPDSFADNMVTLERLTIGEGVEEIGNQSFKNCINLTTINQNLPESLKSIGVEAFMSCTALKGAIHLPESLERIKLRAFEGTRCKLKIDINRTKPIKFASADKDWVNSHVLSIKK